MTSFWLRNMVIIGQGAPNTISKIGGQQGRCLCVWSREKGFCRIYPVPYGYVHDWEVADFEVRLPTNDHRENSYAVYNYEKEWKNLSKRIIVHKDKKLSRKEQIELVNEIDKKGFSDIRDNQKSFGLIKPSQINFVLEKNDKTESSTAQSILFDPENNFDTAIMNQTDFAWLPYVEYTCSSKCSSKHPHKEKIVEWGAYQFMREKPNDKAHCEKLGENYHINDPNYEHHLLIGNLRTYPKTYVIVKIIRFKK